MQNKTKNHNNKSHNNTTIVITFIFPNNYTVKFIHIL